MATQILLGEEECWAMNALAGGGEGLVDRDGVKVAYQVWGTGTTTMCWRPRG